jgi:hypothetical protein
LNWILAFFLGAFMVHQHANPLAFLNAPSLQTIAALLPQLDIQIWLVLIGVVVYTASVLVGLTRRFRREN